MPSPFTIEVREVRSAVWLLRNDELSAATAGKWRLVVQVLHRGTTLQAHYRNCFSAWDEDGSLVPEAATCASVIDEIVQRVAKQYGKTPAATYFLTGAAVSEEVAEQEARAFALLVEQPEYATFRAYRDRIGEYAKMTRYNEDRRVVAE
jgi:hypothetical protein